MTQSIVLSVLSENFVQTSTLSERYAYSLSSSFLVQIIFHVYFVW